MVCESPGGAHGRCKGKATGTGLVCINLPLCLPQQNPMTHLPSSKQPPIKKKRVLFIIFWLHWSWLFLGLFSPVVANVVHGLLIVASLVAEHGL